MKYLFLLLMLAGPVQDSAPPGMVRVPEGEFWMGRTQMWLLDELSMHVRLRLDDQPAHVVNLDSFYIDKYEVTNEDYEKFVQTGHRRPFHWMNGKYPEGREKHPVYNVSWDDADAYCKWAGKRLPSEAEWEKAARGGRDRTMFPWGADLVPGAVQVTRAAANTDEFGTSGDAKKRAHYGAPNGPMKVGSYPPNDYGIYDVIGNVAEWTADWYYRNYYSVSPEANPKGPDTGLYRVIRGSGWSLSDERLLSTYYRNFINPEHRSQVIGFRCAR